MRTVTSLKITYIYVYIYSKDIQKKEAESCFNNTNKKACKTVKSTSVQASHCKH